MPTVHTAAVADGITFRQFAMRCACAFWRVRESASMRDMPADAEPPDEFLPSDYHAKQAAMLRVTLQALRAMTPRQAEAAAEADRLRSVERWSKFRRDDEALRAKYEAMLAEVAAWAPPTPDHATLKAFMHTQLQSSIEYDCGGKYEEPPRQTGEEWLSAAVLRAEGGLARHEREHAEEVRRAAERTAWVRALRRSLPTAEGSK